MHMLRRLPTFVSEITSRVCSQMVLQVPSRLDRGLPQYLRRSWRRQAPLRRAPSLRASCQCPPLGCTRRPRAGDDSRKIAESIATDEEACRQPWTFQEGKALGNAGSQEDRESGRQELCLVTIYDGTRCGTMAREKEGGLNILFQYEANVVK